MNATLKEAAQGVSEFVLDVRHYLHKFPETRHDTARTRSFISQTIWKLSQGAWNCRETESGIIADIDVIGARDRILCRADFDALPVLELTGLPFASTIPGKSHACGHDVATAMLLGFAKLVADGTVKPTNGIRLYFQDAEENPGTAPKPKSGGEMGVEEGVTAGISRAYAVHIWNHPGTPAGVFLSRPGVILGNSGRIHFKVRSSGGHVANPHGGVNALRVCNAIMTRLESFGSRHFNPTHPMTLEPVVLKAGEGTNVMPAEAEMWYGFRTLLPRSEHVEMAARLMAEVMCVTASLGAAITDVELLHGHPPTVNDAETFVATRELLDEHGESVELTDPLLGGEDFAHIAMQVPSAMFMLGAYTPGSGDHHSPTFNPDESQFWRGVHFWTIVATS